MKRMGTRSAAVWWCYDCTYLQGPVHPDLLLPQPRGPQHCLVMMWCYEFIYRDRFTLIELPPAIPAPGSTALPCDVMLWLYLFTGTGSPWPPAIPSPWSTLTALPCDGVPIVFIYRDRFTLTSCYPSPGVHVNPIALHDRQAPWHISHRYGRSFKN